MRKLVVLTLGLMVASTNPASALTSEWTSPFVDGVVEFTEPVTNADGTPLTDLARCSGTVDFIGDGLPERNWEVVASSPTGGQPRQAPVSFAIDKVQAEKVTEVRITGTCEDDKAPPNISTVSTVSLPFTFTFPAPADTMPPNAPTITITITVRP